MDNAAGLLSPGTVPAGWEKRQCASTGRLYYSGKLSGRLSYEVPKHADEKMTESAATSSSSRAQSAEMVRLQKSLEQSERRVIELRDQLNQAQDTIRELKLLRKGGGDATACVSGSTAAADAQPPHGQRDGGWDNSWTARNQGIRAERLSKQDFLGPNSPFVSKQAATGPESPKSLKAPDTENNVTLQEKEVPSPSKDYEPGLSVGGSASSSAPMEADGFSDSWYSRNVGILAERLTKADFLGPDSPWRKVASQAAETTRSRPRALDPKKNLPVTLHEKV